jgi:hypothetical protein
MNFKSTLVALALMNVALVLPLTTAMAADSAVDPAVGTWKLNLGKSKPDPAMPAVTSSVRTYTAMPGGLKVSIKSENADGTKRTVESSFTYDGKPHPVTGVPDYDTIAVTRVGPSESKTDLIKGGKVIGHLTRVVSPDGKSMTITADVTNAKGAMEHDVTVYERQ